MRLLLVSAAHHPGEGGLGTYVWNTCEAGRDAGWHVELLTRSGGPYPPAARIHAISTIDGAPEFASRVGSLRRLERIRPYRYALWSLAAADALAALGGADPFDAVEFHDSRAEGAASIDSIAVRARFGTTPFVVHAAGTMQTIESRSGFDAGRFGRSIYYRWEERALERATAVVAPSRIALAEARRAGSVVPDPVAEVAPAPPTSSETILLVGAVEPNKGADTWIASLGRVLRERVRARAVLVGPDTPTAPGGGSFTAHVRSLLDADLRSRLETTGAIPHEAVLRRIVDAALVVVPSRFESFSYSAAHAIVRGRPVIVSDAVGIAEHVSEAVSFPVADAAALAEAQLRVLRAPARAREAALAARTTLLRCAGYRAHAAAKEAFIASLGRSRPRAAGHSSLEAELRHFVRETEAREETVPAPVSGALETGAGTVFRRGG